MQGAVGLLRLLRLGEEVRRGPEDPVDQGLVKKFRRTRKKNFDEHAKINFDKNLRQTKS